MKARIYKSTGSWYVAKAESGKIYNARIKGVFKIGGLTSTNPIAVGDEVEMQIEDVLEESAMIDTICDRKNYVARVSPHNKHQHHIIAANLDQSLLFATLKDPKTSQGFIDRFLISCEAIIFRPLLFLINPICTSKKNWNILNTCKKFIQILVTG